MAENPNEADRSKPVQKPPSPGYPPPPPVAPPSVAVPGEKRVNGNGPQLYIEQPNGQPRPVSIPTGAHHEDAGAKRRRREERHRQREREAEAQHLKQLEDDARKLYIYGFFALPFLWLISIIYFRNEHNDENASPVIKDYYVKSRLWLIVYTVIFVGWFVLFQIFSEQLDAINILSADVQSPSAASF